MLKLRKRETSEQLLARAAVVWKRQGVDAALEAPPPHGVWLPVGDADQRWQGWLRPSDWLAHVAPELAGLAPSAGTSGLVVQWLASLAQPLSFPVAELNYERLLLGGTVKGEALPQRPMLRLMTSEGPIWLERVPQVDDQDGEAPAGLTWPVRCVLGESRLGLKLLEKVACGDLLLIHEQLSVLRCHDRTLGIFDINEEGIVMEWQEQEDEYDEAVSVSDMGQLPVRLEFVLHRVRLSLDELRAQGSGMLVPLPEGAERKVEILGNGALLGRGELVQLEGQLGVELKEWLGGTSDVE